MPTAQGGLWEWQEEFGRGEQLRKQTATGHRSLIFEGRKEAARRVQGAGACEVPGFCGRRGWGHATAPHLLPSERAPCGLFMQLSTQLSYRREAASEAQVVRSHTDRHQSSTPKALSSM